MGYYVDTSLPSVTGTVAAGMIDRTLPKEQWTHQAHLHTGLWHVLHYDEQAAMDLMRERIRAYNLATGGQNTETSGYHESITRFYLLVIRAVVNASPAGLGMDALADRVIRLAGDAALPFRFYSRERLLSTQARAAWLEPDLAPIPTHWPDQPYK